MNKTMLPKNKDPVIYVKLKANITIFLFGDIQICWKFLPAKQTPPVKTTNHSRLEGVYFSTQPHKLTKFTQGFSDTDPWL